MKNLLISAGEYQFFDEPAIKQGLIGGKIIAVNPETGEAITANYRKDHKGKTNKYTVLGKLISELVPLEEEEEDDEDADEPTKDG